MRKQAILATTNMVAFLVLATSAIWTSKPQADIVPPPSGDRTLYSLIDALNGMGQNVAHIYWDTYAHDAPVDVVFFGPTGAVLALVSPNGTVSYP
jgi:hypothetical protein